MLHTSSPTRYVLRSADGRAVTYDTRTGPALTSNRALCYVWLDEQEAEGQRRAYEAALGVALAVQRQATGGSIASC